MIDKRKFSIVHNVANCLRPQPIGYKSLMGTKVKQSPHSEALQNVKQIQAKVLLYRKKNDKPIQ